MTAHIPAVTIGLPVFNGENYVGDAIDSLLSQTFDDFELIICDNASTDDTAEIVKVRSGDPRVRYVRQRENVGIAANFNQTFELGRAPLFRWAAHDDLWDPKHLEKSFQAMAENPQAVLAFTGAIDVDDAGQTLRTWPAMPRYESARPSDRFEAALTEKETLPLFGLIRREILAGTQRHPSYPGSDRALLAELALLGPFVQVNEPLFLHRQHSKRFSRSTKDRTQRMSSWSPDTSHNLILPHSLLSRDYFRAIRKAKLDREERVRCTKILLKDLRRRRRAIVMDALGGVRHWIRIRLPVRG